MIAEYSEAFDKLMGHVPSMIEYFEKLSAQRRELRDPYVCFMHVIRAFSPPGCEAFDREKLEEIMPIVFHMEEE
jgi:hypothetical protein